MQNTVNGLRLLDIFFSLTGDALEKIVKDQEEFEKEHQFMQVYIKGL